MNLIEDAANDVDHRSKAIKLYKVFSRQILQTPPTGNVLLHLNDDGEQIPYKFLAYEASDVDAVNVLGIDFLIGFSTKFNDTRGMFTKFKDPIFSSKCGILFFGLDELDYPSVKNYVSSLMFRKYFLHEAIHMIDDIRTGYFKSSPKNFRDYINDPVEMNARYHDLVSNLTDLTNEISDIDITEIDDWLALYNLTGNFKQDIVTILKSHDKGNKEFLKWLSDDNRKRLLKRIFGLYKFLLDQIHDKQNTKDVGK